REPRTRARCRWRARAARSETEGEPGDPVADHRRHHLIGERNEVRVVPDEIAGARIPGAERPRAPRPNARRVAHQWLPQAHAEQRTTVGAGVARMAAALGGV